MTAHQEMLDRGEELKIQLEREVQDFLARKGKIRKVPQGACSRSTNQHGKLNRKYPRFLPYRV